MSGNPTRYRSLQLRLSTRRAEKAFGSKALAQGRQGAHAALGEVQAEALKRANMSSE